MNFHFKSNTNVEVKIHEIFHDIEESNLFPEEYFSVFSHIGELVSNVYQHSISGPSDIVDWSLRIQKIENELLITVSDKGQGIKESLNKKNINKPYDKNLIEFAVEETIDSRGMGLRSIFDSVKNSEIHSLKITSGLVTYYQGVADKYIDNNKNEFQGVEATIVLLLEAIS